MLIYKGKNVVNARKKGLQCDTLKEETSVVKNALAGGGHDEG